MDVDTALAVVEAESQSADGENLDLAALSPSDLLAAQTNLINWCDRKTTALHAELSDLRENLRIAKESKWRTGTLQSQVLRTERRVVFYDKIKAAVAAGYLIVPNFPIDVFAVRVSRARPKTQIREGSRWANTPQAPAEILPAGEGRYVDDRLARRDESYTETLPDKSTKTNYRFVSDEFIDEIGFPVQAVKPVVLDATQRAMALRIFDQVGVVTNSGQFMPRKGDPIVIGRLLDPRGNGRCVSFFVAWWLNTRDL